MLCIEYSSYFYQTRILKRLTEESDGGLNLICKVLEVQELSLDSNESQH
jgi:hypothetical protein